MPPVEEPADHDGWKRTPTTAELVERRRLTVASHAPSARPLVDLLEPPRRTVARCERAFDQAIADVHSARDPWEQEQAKHGRARARNRLDAAREALTAAIPDRCGHVGDHWPNPLSDYGVCPCGERVEHDWRDGCAYIGDHRPLRVWAAEMEGSRG
jgi:hypothetical protein